MGGPTRLRRVCGHASAAVVRLDSYDLREATDMHIAGHGDLARQSKNKFDGTPSLELSVDHEVKDRETDVPRLSLPFNPAVRTSCPDRQRKRHSESPRR